MTSAAQQRVARAERVLLACEREALTALSVWFKAGGGRVAEGLDRVADRQTLFLLDRMRRTAQRVGHARANLAQEKRDMARERKSSRR